MRNRCNLPRLCHQLAGAYKKPQKSLENRNGCLHGKQEVRSSSPLSSNSKANNHKDLCQADCMVIFVAIWEDKRERFDG